MNDLEMTERQFEIALDALITNERPHRNSIYCPICGSVFKHGPTLSFLDRHARTIKHKQALGRIRAVKEMLERSGLLKDCLSIGGSMNWRVSRKELSEKIYRRWKIELAAREAMAESSGPRSL